MTRASGCAATLLLGVLLLAALPADAQSPTAGTQAAPTVQLAVPASGKPDAHTGVDIYEAFVGGLGQPACEDASPRWESHFAHVPAQLAAVDSEVLPLFGYVVDALRQAHLPTEYALIPFVESGYRPGARSASGPAGLWQFIALTARNHRIPMRPGFDGRLSPVEATRAAVRYLKTLHGMFAGDWRLAVMAFNAGEYRVLGALKRHDMRAANARPEALESLSGITRAYVVKLHALSCLMVEAGRQRDFREALDRPVARLVAIELPADAASLDAFAARQGLDAARLKRLNPAFAPQGSSRAGGVHVLVPAAAATAPRGAVAN
ncbi:MULTISPECIES: lytic transglycosylase domain-containing protein [unclassified Luteimonas]|uniref:lytic transglycosylase domain-containing protein n=1 Tax=unclassified Luteimonas TaxID=2629088 RepID=UPI00160479EF|nr:MULTISPECIES: lytic transglycosylase domain-containing protein [unclassified Luteimonas]MBB1471485.1 lytic transglycosylase domain-containing protein [Luteimonas sp. MC1782]